MCRAQAAGSSGVMDDGAFIDGTLGFTDNVHYDKDGTALTMREERLHKNWDSSTWRYTPHVLKGIRPVTKEPWARDEVVYHESRNSVDFRGAGDLSSFEAIGYNGDADDAPLWDATRHAARRRDAGLPRVSGYDTRHAFGRACSRVVVSE